MGNYLGVNKKDLFAVFGRPPGWANQLATIGFPASNPAKGNGVFLDILLREMDPVAVIARSLVLVHHNNVLGLVIHQPLETTPLLPLLASTTLQILDEFSDRRRIHERDVGQLPVRTERIVWSIFFEGSHPAGVALLDRGTADNGSDALNNDGHDAYACFVVSD
jgi:hypothetical protein